MAVYLPKFITIYRKINNPEKLNSKYLYENNFTFMFSIENSSKVENARKMKQKDANLENARKKTNFWINTTTIIFFLLIIVAIFSAYIE